MLYVQRDNECGMLYWSPDAVTENSNHTVPKTFFLADIWPDFYKTVYAWNAAWPKHVKVTHWLLMCVGYVIYHLYFFC